MKHRRLSIHALIIGALCFCTVHVSAQDAAGNAQQYLARTIAAQVVVAEREHAATVIAEFADANGGYFTYKSLDRVIIRIPGTTEGELRKLLVEISDDIVFYNTSSYDRRSELIALDAGISSREEALDQIVQYFETADTAATLAFERELRSLSGEIEYYKGRRLRIINDIRFASATVDLSTLQSDIPRDLPSSFRWINTVSLYRFLDEVQR